MALDNYTKEEAAAIDKFLGDSEAWRSVGRSRPARDFAGLKKLAEQQRNIKAEVDERIKRERETVDAYLDENGRLGGKIPLGVLSACRRIAGEEIGNTSVFGSEEVFQRYLHLLKTVCEELKGW